MCIIENSKEQEYSSMDKVGNNEFSVTAFKILMDWSLMAQLCKSVNKMYINTPYLVILFL